MPAPSAQRKNINRGGSLVDAERALETNKGREGKCGFVVKKDKDADLARLGDFQERCG